MFTIGQTIDTHNNYGYETAACARIYLIWLLCLLSHQAHFMHVKFINHSLIIVLGGIPVF